MIQYKVAAGTIVTYIRLHSTRTLAKRVRVRYLVNTYMISYFAYAYITSSRFEVGGGGGGGQGPLGPPMIIFLHGCHAASSHPQCNDASTIALQLHSVQIAAINASLNEGIRRD